MPFERELRCYSVMREYGDRLLADLSDEQWHAQPAPGMNSPVWIIGHLAICSDYGLMLLDKPMVFAQSWHRDFGPGSKPNQPAEPYPSRVEIVGAWRTGHERLDSALRLADEAALAMPHSVELGTLKTSFPSKAELMAHLLATHEAGHLGQLSAVRRALGLPSLM